MKSKETVVRTRRYTVLIDAERCKGCRLCAETCPRRVLQMAASLNSRGYHPAEVVVQSDCTGCALCALMCPDAAIEITEDDEA